MARRVERQRATIEVQAQELFASKLSRTRTVLDREKAREARAIARQAVDRVLFDRTLEVRREVLGTLRLFRAVLQRRSIWLAFAELTRSRQVAIGLGLALSIFFLGYVAGINAPEEVVCQSSYSFCYQFHSSTIGRRLQRLFR